ncbi:MAG: copper chaperone PCu(A)C [Pseudomonadota bacterium]|nr:copper chaperone PCu(A)C [Pseudomonadota bacterium]
MHYILAITLGIFFFNSSLLAADKLEVRDAWVREAPPNAKAHAGYGVFKNKSKHSVTFISVRSPDYQKVELHQSEVQNGVATMRKKKSLTIPAGGEIKLMPGSLHLMLLNPVTGIKMGDKIKMILVFLDGASQSFSAVVKRSNDIPKSHSHMGH